MKNLAKHLQQRLFPALCILATSALTAGMSTLPASAQTAVASPRISGEVTSNQLSLLAGSKHPMAVAKYDTGRVAPSTKLEGISIYFNHTQSQEAAIQKLIAAQQNPSSPQYHQWLTPEQFGSRFGMADSDLAKVQSWLEEQGFTVNYVARGKDLIRFSGTAGQVDAAFATELHNYNIPTLRGVEKHMAPSTELSLPSALSGVVLGVRGLDDFRPRPHVVASKAARIKPNFTSSETGNVYFAPGDIATVYDIQNQYKAGYSGSGQSIAIVGQSQIALSDIEAFQTAAGLSIKDPTLILVPDSGTGQISSGDETESDLDLEWSGAIAKDATIYFVYTGNSSTNGAFDALTWAIDNKLANIVSSSYGDCETDLGTFSLETVLEEASTQGQTVISASGDDGTTDCYADTDLTTAQQQSPSVDYPASSPYVTGLGGTEISTANSAYLTSGSAYWEAATTSDVISSALSYIPEVAWNEDSANCGESDCLGSSGGGASALFTKPTWQTGVPGIPSDGHRDVPDISLNASTGLPGYLFCTSDQSFWESGQAASCNSGFRDASTGDLTIAGGTSFAAPIFAGMLALINQQQNYTTGQGLINPELYTLAADGTTYASAFHDITSGNNDCPSGTGLCNSTVTGFAAGTGYDQVTGLGSIDLYNLANAWTANSSATPLIDTTTTISASNAAPAVNANDTFTITVASTSGSTIPTGTVTLTIDSGTPITGNALTSNGTVTYTTAFTTAGTHQVIATYTGDSTHASSTGTVTVNVPSTSSGTGTFALKATNLTVTDGSSGSSTITVTPAGGYLGTVDLTFDTSNDTALQNLCYSFTNTTSNGDGTVVVSSTSAVTTQLTFDTNAADCATTAAVAKTGKHAMRTLHRTNSAKNTGGNIKEAPVAAAFAALMLFGFLGRYARKFRSLAGVIVLIVMGFAISACGGGNSSTISNPPTGSYTITVTGNDSATATIPTATTTFTFTIQ